MHLSCVGPLLLLFTCAMSGAGACAAGTASHTEAASWQASSPALPSSLTPRTSHSSATYLVGENDARSRYRVGGSPPLVAELVTESAQRQGKGLDG